MYCIYNIRIYIYIIHILRYILFAIVYNIILLDLSMSWKNARPRPGDCFVVSLALGREAAHGTEDLDPYPCSQWRFQWENPWVMGKKIIGLGTYGRKWEKPTYLVGSSIYSRWGIFHCLIWIWFPENIFTVSPIWEVWAVVVINGAA